MVRNARAGLFHAQVRERLELVFKQAEEISEFNGRLPFLVISSALAVLTDAVSSRTAHNNSCPTSAPKMKAKKPASILSRKYRLFSSVQMIRGEDRWDGATNQAVAR
jgi:hypothetical protein